MSTGNTNFIPCVKWVKRGVAKSKPDVVRLTKEELKDLVEIAKHDILESAEELKRFKTAKTKKEQPEAEYVELRPGPQNDTSKSETKDEDDEFNMQDYDNDEEATSLSTIGNLISLDDFDNQQFEEDEDDDDSEKEDDEIKPTDNLIAVGHVFEDTSILEVYVYNEESNDLYVHHDMVLPTVPLALEWLNHDRTNTSGNLLAVGGMTPEITIWNLDMVNCIEPLTKLGTFSKIKKHLHRNHGHRDAVLDLSWNPKLPHALASGSVDRTVRLWDLDIGRSVTQFSDFQDKVQTLEWHPSEVNILLTGACDSFVRLLDCRVEETLNSFKVTGEVERVVWHPINQFQALVGTSVGELSCVDLRTEKVLWMIAAHSKELTGIGIHEENSSSIITCSMDETVKLWDSSNKEPVLINTKYVNQKLQCLQMCPENPNILCVGGDGKQSSFNVFNLLKDLQHETDTKFIED